MRIKFARVQTVEFELNNNGDMVKTAQHTDCWVQECESPTSEPPAPPTSAAMDEIVAEFGRSFTEEFPSTEETTDRITKSPRRRRRRNAR